MRIQYALKTYKLSGQTEEEETQQGLLFHEKLQCLSRIDPKLLIDFLEMHKEEKYMLESIIEVIKSVIPVQIKRKLPPMERASTPKKAS